MQAVMDTPDTVKPASDRNMIEEARRVCEAASQGNLEVRILGIDPEHEMAPMLFALNHLLDMSDAFVREATASLSYAGQGKFFRRVLPEGMLGTFANAALFGLLNLAIVSMLYFTTRRSMAAAV